MKVWPALWFSRPFLFRAGGGGVEENNSSFEDKTGENAENTEDMSQAIHRNPVYDQLFLNRVEDVEEMSQVTHRLLVTSPFYTKSKTLERCLSSQVVRPLLATGHFCLRNIVPEVDLDNQLQDTTPHALPSS